MIHPLATARRLLGFMIAGLLLGAGVLRATEPGWIELRSPHFTIITDGSEKNGREVALRFEQMRSVFGALLLKERLNQIAPITILALSSDKSYYQMAALVNGKPTTVPGFFVTGEDRVYFVLNLFEPQPWRAVAHDFAHIFLNANYPPAEGWFDEGLAEYFASIQPDNKQVLIGSDPELSQQYSVDLLENVTGTATPPKSLTELLNAQVWISIPDLFTMAHDTAREGTHRTLYYAESWMVVHYLVHNNKLPEAGTYFDLALNKHVAPDQAVEQAFGMKPSQLEQAVKDYFHSLTVLQVALDAARQPPGAPPVPTVVYQFPAPLGPDDFAITLSKMQEADAHALAAGIMTHVPERRQQGLDQLHTLANTVEPTRKEKEKDQDKAQTVTAVGNELAHRLLAADAIEHGQFDDATRELGDAAMLDPHDVWVRYDLCVLKARIAESSHRDIQGLPNMMLDLRAVLEAYPDIASAYDLLAQARLLGGGNVTAMQTERTAMQLSPRNQLYPLHLAQIYAAAKQWDAARALLDRLKLSTDPQIAARAREILDQIASNQKYGMSGVAEGSKTSAQPSPFDVLAEDAAKRASTAAQPRTTGPLGGHASRFLKGRLMSVDCSHPPSATLAISSSGGLFKLRSADTARLPVIGAPSFSCDWTDRNVSVNYVPGDLNNGELLSLELH